jgi:beta-glucosidase
VPAPEASEVGGSCEKPSPLIQTAFERRTTAASATVSSPELALIRSLKARGIPVVAIFLTGRPLWITPELDAANAFVVAWLPGSEGGGVADVLFRKKNGKPSYDFTGTLSFSWRARPTPAG